MREDLRLFLIRLGLACSLCLFGGASYATLYDVNLATGGTASGGTGSGTSTMTWALGTSGGATYALTATAYSTDNAGTSYGYRTSEGAAYNAGYTSNSTYASGTWSAAHVNQYGGGLGIQNNKDESAGYATNSSAAPQHAIDNNGAIDIMVFSLLKNGVATSFNPTTFKFGYTNNDSDVQAWIGGNTVAFDPANACLVGCLTAAKNITNTLSGFTEITNTIAPTTPDVGGAATGTNIVAGTTEYFNTSQTGKYLVMTGNLGLGAISGGNDFFKISGLAINQSIGIAPSPATAPLLLLGLMALGYARRRRIA